LRALTEKTYQNLNFLEKSGNFKAKTLTVVGGGSKNTLWNQLRANRLKIPVRLIEQTETTVLGAALFAFSGIGFYKSPYEARKAFNIKSQIIEPNNVFSRL
jgi:L-fuculokinase